MDLRCVYLSPVLYICIVMMYYMLLLMILVPGLQEVGTGWLRADWVGGCWLMDFGVRDGLIEIRVVDGVIPT